MWNPNTEQCIQHFSHEHPLQIFNIQERPLGLATCSGCKLKPSFEWVYGCRPCNYILHIHCSQMHQLIRYPADPNHSLALLLQPSYPDGKFRCDACGEEGNGFCYHCRTCGLDIHILCAIMPLSVTHQTHPHPLNLAFSIPYHTKSFCCDICLNNGSNHWVYRCNGCGFDVHLNCATSKSSVHQHQTRSPLLQPQYNSFPAANHPYFQSTGVGASGQDYLQDFIAQQQANQEALLKLMQDNSSTAEMNDFILGLMGAQNGRISAAQAFGQGFMQYMNGGNGGSTYSGAIQLMTQSLLQNMMGGNDGGIGVDLSSSIIQNLFGLL